MVTTATPQETFVTTVDRLSRLSVERHADAYADIEWDSPEMALRPGDPRLEPWRADPVVHTEWYQSRSPEERSRYGLHRTASVMRTGWEFENILQRGLLRYAFDLPNGAPEFRYLHHEIVEESQHTMMFQEFVNRSGLRAAGMPRPIKAVSHLVVPLARWAPSLFFFFVLAGEDPVDHLQRLHLKQGSAHPLVERIMRIHVAEEARHLSFARHYLKRHVPEIGPVRRAGLAVAAPVLFGLMGRLMVYPASSVLRAERVPRSQVRRALRSEEMRTLLRDSLAKPRCLCDELGLIGPVTRRLWDVMGIGDDPAGANNPAASVDPTGADDPATSAP